MAANYWNIDMVGVLASNEYVSQKKGDGVNPIYINKQGQLQYIVRLISEPPENFPKVDLFTGYISNIEKYGFEEQLNLDDDSRKINFENEIEDYFIIFNVRQKGDYYNIENVKLKRKIDSFDKSKETLFISVPFFKEENHELEIDNFLDKIIKRQYLGKIENVSTEEDDTPQYIIWGKDEFSDLYAIGMFDKHRYAFGGFQFEYEQLKYTKIKQNCLEYSFINPDSKQIFFIENNTYSEILNELEHCEPYNIIPGAIKQNDNKILALKNNEETGVKGIDAEIPSEKSEENIYTDENLIDNFLQITRENNFIYDEKDLINFHVSMKVSNLVILSGMSGTGKSRLVYFYAKALGMDDTQFKIIPVRPSWNDDSDLLGYVDSIHMIYKPGESGLIDILTEASKDNNIQDKLYIICFDEMNLARVEHYFSQFLSVLEMEPGKRCLKLYSEELDERLYNSSKYPQNLKIGDNIMFVGTVNVDESTYHFSDKVLDRANVINLKIKDDFLNYKIMTIENSDDKNIKPKGKKYDWTYQLYKKSKANDKQIELSDRDLLFFGEIHKKLNQINNNIGIGYRIIKQIDLFVKNLPDNLPQERNISKEEAIDIQLVQRVLTKIRGAEEQLKELLDISIDDNLFTILDKYSDVSEFKYSRQVLEQKRRELMLYGYAL